MGVLFYYAIIDEVVDETDDTLENYAEILIEHVLHDSSLLETEGSLSGFCIKKPETNNLLNKIFFEDKIYDTSKIVDSGNNSI